MVSISNICQAHDCILHKNMGANAFNTANMTYVQQVQYSLATKIMQKNDVYIKVLNKNQKTGFKEDKRNVYLNVSHHLVIDFSTQLCINMSLGDVRPAHQWKFDSLN